MKFTAEVFYNCQMDDKGRRIAMMDGFKALDPLACITEFEFESEGDFKAAAEVVYRQMNHVDGTEHIASMPNNRSMSVGDVVKLTHIESGCSTWMTVADIGFEYIFQPTNIITGQYSQRGERV